jgi:hypothetical protein
MDEASGNFRGARWSLRVRTKPARKKKHSTGKVPLWFGWIHNLIPKMLFFDFILMDHNLLLQA